MNAFLLIRGVPALALLCALGGCALSNDAGPGSGDMGAAGGNGGGGGGSGNGGGGGSGGGGSGGATGGGGSGGSGSGDMAMGSGGTLPFAVDSQFVPSGYMGDGASTGLVTMTPAKAGDSNTCNGARANANAVGVCHGVVYAPPASGGVGWAGVYWQFPANNWGSKSGYSIPAGATKVTFVAKGNKGGEKVTFLAGGISGATNVYNDTVKASVVTTLTSDWASYSIDLTAQSYTQVLGGFGWTMAATDVAAASGSFFVDDIKWQ